MSFTIAQAITRLSGGPKNIFLGLSAAQELQRINEVLERFWNEGSWEGLYDDVTPTSSVGIITLAAGYKKLDSLQVSTVGSEQPVPIKSQLWKLTPSANYIGDWTNFAGPIMAFDKGESAGQRIYQLTGTASVADAYTYTGQAKKRYVWASGTSGNVIPDCYTALLMGVRAYNWLDQGDGDRFRSEFNEALNQLAKDLSSVQDTEDSGSVTIDPQRGGGSLLNLM